MVINELEPISEPSKTPQEVKIILGDSTKVLKIGIAILTLEEMIFFLRANQDVFAWKHEDMPVIDRKIIQHRLNVNLECKPVQQKQRIFTPKRNKTVTKEVEKLLEADFISEVFYPDWLANVVMVKKSNGKWRMCVDFTELNKACPKDSFPLPRIDQLLELTARHKLLSFMDAFFWIQPDFYGQRRSREDLVCYKPRVILVQSYALWIEERRSHLPKIGEPYVLSPYWKECESVRRRYASEMQG